MTTYSNSMLDEVRSLPDLLPAVVAEAAAAVAALPDALLAPVRRVVVAGSGDSYFAGLATRLAVETVAGVVADPMTSLQLSRYGTESLLAGGPGRTLVVPVSVSGSTARTVESAGLARAAGAVTVGLTLRPGSRLADVADATLVVRGTPWTDPEPTTTPGVRSWAVTVVTLLLLGARVAEARGRDPEPVAGLRAAVGGLADAVDRTLAGCLAPAADAVDRLRDTGRYDVLGAGPNLATAHFAAAKLIEACGDHALGQDIEEWAHLQFYTRGSDTGTMVVTAADRDAERAGQVLDAAASIGRPTVAVVPADRAGTVRADAVLPFAAGLPEAYTPLVAAVPVEVLAACRAQRLGETYFRPDRPITISRIKEPTGAPS